MNANVFSAFADTRGVKVTFTLGTNTCIGMLELTKSPNPYMLDIDPAANNPYWLSTDVRVFKVLESEMKFGDLTQGSGGDAPYTFIKQVLDKFVGAPNDAAFNLGKVSDVRSRLAKACEWDEATGNPVPKAPTPAVSPGPSKAAPK